ncbi:YdcH family protein [Ferrimonas lipolytica]|uniref:YdcH family protein n=1 Tax=Ferrimonas lipolytica TaxID=2724191 RepID=A0A6H1U9E6_9GAMM|nr:YdcH family protein [Ferrimonas lipolytica]QIZ75667.1 YdcH family protein [Ferrimonas lipolytica]
MLGENHALRIEFPDHLDAINALAAQDEVFSKDLKHYDLLDQEIRKLELRNTPVSDDTIHELKHERMALKDSLHKRVIDSEK